MTARAILDLLCPARKVRHAHAQRPGDPPHRGPRRVPPPSLDVRQPRRLHPGFERHGFLTQTALRAKLADRMAERELRSRTGAAGRHGGEPWTPRCACAMYSESSTLPAADRFRGGMSLGRWT